MKRCKLKRASMGSLPGQVVYFRGIRDRDRMAIAFRFACANAEFYCNIWRVCFLFVPAMFCKSWSWKYSPFWIFFNCMFCFWYKDVNNMKRCKLKRASMGSLPGQVVYFRDMHSVLCLYHIGHHVEDRSSCTFNVNRIALNKWSTFLLLILWNWKMKTYHTRKNGGSMVFNAI
jgi:hypothetical protein